MADYSQYNSNNNAYEFSKGPKSLYFGLGDDQLLGLVLNVPQTDADDEWGGTERIGWERIVDKVSQLMVEVEDPYGSGTGGLVNRVNALLGTPGGAAGLIDLTVPSMTLGDIIINGSLNKVTIGTTAELAENSLKLADFTISQGSNSYSAVYGKNSLKFFDDLLNTPYTDILVDGNAFRFTVVSGLGEFQTVRLKVTGTAELGNVTMTSSTIANLSVTGTLTTGNIVPAVTATSDIGSSGVTYRQVYSDTVTSTNLMCSINLGGDIGSNAVRWGTVYTEYLNVSSSIYCAGSISATSISSTNASIGDTLEARLFTPYNDGNPHDIGATGQRWENIYAKNLDLTGTLQCVGNIATMGSVNSQFSAVTGTAALRTAKVQYLMPSDDWGGNIGAASGAGFPRWDNIYAINLDLTGTIQCVGNVATMGAFNGSAATIVGLISSETVRTRYLLPSDSWGGNIGNATPFSGRWEYIYAEHLNLTGSITCDSINVGSANSSFAGNVQIAAEVQTNNIMPTSNFGFSIGSSLVGFKEIYLIDQNNTSVRRRLHVEGTSLIVS
jgi:hypothetical protein